MDKCGTVTGAKVDVTLYISGLFDGGQGDGGRVMESGVVERVDCHSSSVGGVDWISPQLLCTAASCAHSS